MSDDMSHLALAEFKCVVEVKFHEPHIKIGASSSRLLSHFEFIWHHHLLMTELVIDFVSHLRSHASGHRVIDEIRDAIDDFSKSVETVIDQSENGAKASKDLDAVGNSNQSVIACVRLEVVLLHDVNTRGRHCDAIYESNRTVGSFEISILLHRQPSRQAQKLGQLDSPQAPPRMQQQILKYPWKQEYLDMSPLRIFRRRRH